MKRHLQCAEQQESSPIFTKYCVRLPRKINLIIDPHNRWIVISNAQTKQSITPILLQY